MSARREMGDVTVNELLFLLHVALQPGITQRELQASMHLPKSSISKFAWKLEQGGLLEQRVDPTERRRRLLYLTEAAQVLLGKITGELR